MPAAFASASGLTLRTVRMRGTADGWRARLGLEAALAGVADKADGGLLVVRRLAPVTPLGLSGTAQPGAFRRAVEAAVAEHRAGARRPWTDPDADAGEAVLFADEAEMLACLVRDWLRGHTRTWFWHAVLRGALAERVLSDAARQRGALVPAVLALLASCGEAGAWVARLSDAVTDAIAAAVATAHGVGHAWKPETSPVTTPVSVPAMPIADPPARPRPRGRETIVLAQRLRSVIPEVALPGLRPAHYRLLGLALALYRAPALARAFAFAAALQEVSAVHHPSSATSVRTTPEPDAVIGMPVTPPPQRTPDFPAPLWPTGGAAAPLGEQQRLHQVGVDATNNANATGDGPFSARRATLSLMRRTTPRLPSAAAPDANPLLEGGSDETLIYPVRGDPANRGTPDVALRGIAEPSGVRATESGFGGLFYLLNVATAFGLYGDFTQPSGAGLTLSPWDFLALAGRHWFGTVVEQDPIWALLAQLSGRSATTPPGSRFTPPAAWTVPPDWLPEAEPLATACVYVTRRRISLLHPDGFVLAQASHRMNEPPRTTARAMADACPALRQVRLIRGVPPALPRGVRARWIAMILATITARLGHALDVQPTDAPTLLCRHTAHIGLAPTTVAVHLSLAELPLPIRMAGLDRDPGWIPAAGRSVIFHFE